MYCVACEASCGEFCYDAPDGTAEEKALDLFERGLEIWNTRVKKFTYKEAWANAWNNADDEQKRWFLSLPNFDADIFFEITGIRV